MRDKDRDVAHAQDGGELVGADPELLVFQIDAVLAAANIRVCSWATPPR